MNKQRNILLWQMIVGMMLCVGLIVVAFAVPRFGINSGAIARSVSKAYSKIIKSMGAAGDLMGAAYSQEDLEEQIKDSVDDILDEAEEEGIKLRFTSGSIIFKSYGTLVDEFLGEEGIYDELMEESDEDDPDIVIFKKLKSSYNAYRVSLICLTVIPVVLLILLLLTYLTPLPKLVSMILTWLWTVANIAFVVIWQFVVPSKIVSEGGGVLETALGGYIGLDGFDISDMGSKVVKPFVTALWGSLNLPGYWIWNGLVLLVFIWSILCMVTRKKQVGYDTADTGYGMQFEGYSQMQGYDNNMSGYGDVDYDTQTAAYNEEILPSSEHTMAFDDPMDDVGKTEALVQDNLQQQMEQKTGTLRGVTGTIAGGTLELKAGEPIMIGRDPAVCQLILNHPKVSRKHCYVSYQLEQDAYEVVCYSHNGLLVSDGQEIHENERKILSRGVQLIFANGKEMIALD